MGRICWTNKYFVKELDFICLPCKVKARCIELGAPLLEEYDFHHDDRTARRAGLPPLGPRSQSKPHFAP